MADSDRRRNRQITIAGRRIVVAQRLLAFVVGTPVIVVFSTAGRGFGGRDKRPCGRGKQVHCRRVHRCVACDPRCSVRVDHSDAKRRASGAGYLAICGCHDVDGIGRLERRLGTRRDRRTAAHRHVCATSESGRNDDGNTDVDHIDIHPRSIQRRVIVGCSGFRLGVNVDIGLCLGGDFSGYVNGCRAGGVADFHLRVASCPHCQQLDHAILDRGFDITIDFCGHVQGRGGDRRGTHDVDYGGRETGDQRAGDVVTEECVPILGVTSGHVDLAERVNRHRAGAGGQRCAVDLDCAGRIGAQPLDEWRAGGVGQQR